MTGITESISNKKYAITVPILEINILVRLTCGIIYLIDSFSTNLDIVPENTRKPNRTPKVSINPYTIETAESFPPVKLVNPCEYLLTKKATILKRIMINNVLKDITLLLRSYLNIVFKKAPYLFLCLLL